MFVTRKTLLNSAIALCLAPAALADEVLPEEPLERITIRGEYRQIPINQAATSVSVLGRETIEERAAVHIEDVLNAIPNVNFSGGTSRARFIQIRGIGERSQFVDPINPSVGLLIDGINYSGLGQAAQLFDISQVEVYRGPQSGRFGADGLAGMMVMETTRPGKELSGIWELGVGNYDELKGGVAVGGSLGALGQARVSIYQHSDDGFTNNIYLNRDDTQQRDELTARFNLYSDLGNDWQLRTTLHALNQDNGYDAFSLDNNRNTLSDQPGEDDLSSNAARFALSYTGLQHSELQLSYSTLSADSTYSYDEDWSYVGIAPGWEYSSFDSYVRDRRDHTLEARWLSTAPMDFAGVPTDWVLGLYGYQRDEDLRRDFFNWDLYTQATFLSSYESDHTAIYGELTQHLSSSWQLVTGLRAERYENDYADSNGITAQPEDTMWGGRISLSYMPDNNSLWYTTLARGYKPGGVNGAALGKAKDQQLSEIEDFLLARATFAPELLSSLEVGYKFNSDDDRLVLRSALFYHSRDDVQLKSWINRQQSFVGYIENAASGEAMGAEVELSYQVSEPLRSFVNLGLLNTEIEGFVTEDGMDMSGRDQAHAPNYQVNAGFDYQLTETLQLTVQADAKDSFYYSNSHNQESDSMVLLHANLAWQLNNWQLSLWARNLTDEEYGIRGFYFGNDPRIGYEPELFEQFGEPRRFGVTASFRF
ncbi:TonB-dependent receptor [Pseudidiomarina sp.]|uniref:TonB-dependent receptor n=1 Tax=Pseudidiomarina sp. TaxID=2081707 RepID=UPI00299DA94E|nr:TonB-dependent receptor [Pseudidiomarina sp.]MDX1705386.1 TonB-dependent receptor [Pseudidiomarina sp.]